MSYEAWFCLPGKVRRFGFSIDEKKNQFGFQIPLSLFLSLSLSFSPWVCESKVELERISPEGENR